MRDPGESCGLVQTAEFDVRRNTSSDVENVERDIRAGRLWEERVVCDRRVEGCSNESFRQIPIRLGFSDQQILSRTMKEASHWISNECSTVIAHEAHHGVNICNFTRAVDGKFSMYDVCTIDDDKPEQRLA